MSLIRNIEIKNFKSIRHQKIDGCKRINVFIGYPNVGKSNILEAIGLYSCFLLWQDYFKLDDICRLKRFSELFFNKEYRNNAKVILNEKISLELGINSVNNLGIAAYDERMQFELFKADVNIKDFHIKLEKNVSDVALKGIVDYVRKYEFRNNAKINRQTPLALGIPFGENLLDILHRDSKLRKETAALFEDYNQKLVIDDEEILFLKYLSDDTAVSIPYHLVADTLKRLIFFKAAILSNEKSILLLEEPEAHMFPPYISKLTSDIWYYKSNQYFISTHSPFVVNDFLENMKEELAIYVVEYKKEIGETIINRLTDDQVHEAYQYGIDLFFNLESITK